MFSTNVHNMLLYFISKLSIYWLMTAVIRMIVGAANHTAMSRSMALSLWHGQLNIIGTVNGTANGKGNGTAWRGQWHCHYRTPNQKFIVVATLRMIGIHRLSVDGNRRPSLAFHHFQCRKCRFPDVGPRRKCQ